MWIQGEQNAGRKIDMAKALPLANIQNDALRILIRQMLNPDPSRISMKDVCEAIRTISKILAISMGLIQAYKASLAFRYQHLLLVYCAYVECVFQICWVLR